MKLLFAGVIVGFLGFSPALAQSEGKQDIFSTKDLVEKSVKDVPCEQDKRRDGVKRLFSSAGAAEAEITIEKYDKDKIQNVVVRKKGSTDETVILGAHYDRTDSGCGVTDNWTGVVILAHIYKSLRPLNTKKSYVFVAFDKEEEGLKGSHQMVKAMSKDELTGVCSMVNFDSFGQGYPMSLTNISSPKMLKLAEALGKESGVKFTTADFGGATSDSASFRDKKIPAITLSGLGNNWIEILHSSSDQVSNVNIDSVYLGYRFGLLYLSKLEQAGCRDFQ